MKVILGGHLWEKIRKGRRERENGENRLSMYTSVESNE